MRASLTPTLHLNDRRRLASRANIVSLCCQFVIVAAFDHTDVGLPVQERIALGLKRCGVSISCKNAGRLTGWPRCPNEKKRPLDRGGL